MSNELDRCDATSGLLRRRRDQGGGERDELVTHQTASYTYAAKTAPTYVWGNMIYAPGPAHGYGLIDCNGPYDYSGYTGIAQ